MLTSFFLFQVLFKLRKALVLCQNCHFHNTLSISLYVNCFHAMYFLLYRKKHLFTKDIYKIFEKGYFHIQLAQLRFTGSLMVTASPTCIFKNILLCLSFGLDALGIFFFEEFFLWLIVAIWQGMRNEIFLTHKFTAFTLLSLLLMAPLKCRNMHSMNVLLYV